MFGPGQSGMVGSSVQSGLTSHIFRFCVRPNLVHLTFSDFLNKMVELVISLIIVVVYVLYLLRVRVGRSFGFPHSVRTPRCGQCHGLG